METSSQSSKPRRREPLRAIYVGNAPVTAKSSAEPQPQLDSNASEPIGPSQPSEAESPRKCNSVCAESTSATPFRRSSSQRPYTTGLSQAARPTASSGRSFQTASHTRSHTSRVANPPPTKQPEIEKQIDMEVEDAVFLDDDFVQNFLSGDSKRLSRVLDYCKSTPGHAGGWSLPKEGPESTLYRPIVEVLNTIKRAVDSGSQTNSDDQPDANDLNDDDVHSDNGDPPELTQSRFLDHSTHAIPSDDSDSNAIKPDIVLFEGQHEHWENVRMAIEVKANPKDLREGMKQLSRYARAIYAHQLHRRHLYGLVVCGPKVTFVRYDRAGILHSPEIDMCESFEMFTKAFASWLMLDRAGEGYDPAFSTTINHHRRLEYYVDLPESAFDEVPAEPGVAGPSGSSESEDVIGLGAGSLPTRRFKVIERLCHRKSIRGRATIVLRIREALESDEVTDKGKGNGEETKGKGKDSTEGSTRKRKAEEMSEQQRPHYILKLIWRDPHRESEGDVMRILRGMFALAQYVWHCDVAVACVCGTGGACKTCVDETPRPKNLKRSPVMGSTKATSVEGCATKSASVVESVTGNSSGCVRTHRVYSRILMSSVGEPLWVANSAEEFLRALLDAILGYWRLVNLGILHRDISDGNVMLLRGAQGYSRRQWLEERDENVETLREQFGDMAGSESKLRKVLNNLGRDPTGMVSDFDLHTKHQSAPPIPGATNDVMPPTSDSGVTPRLRSDVSSASQTLCDKDSELPTKRLKTNLKTSVPAATSTSENDNDKEVEWVLARLRKRRSHGASAYDQRRPLVDFRTGTPTFMSVRVLQTNPGIPCPHTFMDDLESFFWLLVWSVAAHLDPKKKAATSNAQDTLHMLDNDNMRTIAGSKLTILLECSISRGDGILERLSSFENEWAESLSVGWLILKMGEYFSSQVHSKIQSTPEPATVFPEIVNMISKALTL